MARRAEDLTNDPVLVLIRDEDEPGMSAEEWLASLDEDEPTDEVIDAAAIIRDIREHGER